MWIFVEFGDNDFAKNMEYAGDKYADTYNNVILRMKRLPEMETMDTRLSMKECVKRMTDTECIKNILENGYVMSCINDNLSGYYPILKVDDVIQNSRTELECLDLNGKIHIFDNEDDCLTYIVSHFASLQDKDYDGSFNKLQCNGECLVMWTDNGWMRSKVI